MTLIHGHARRGRHTTEHVIWCAMTKRCTNPHAKGFAYYGGRGICVCRRWKKFENFLADMGPRPKGLTLERINNDGNYEPRNCKWATRSEQLRNRRQFRIKGARGCYFRPELNKTHPWIAQISRRGHVYYLGYFCSEAEAHVAFEKAKNNDR